MLIRNPEAVSNKQAGCAVFINGLPVNTITTSSLILSEVDVEIRVEVEEVAVLAVAVSVSVDGGLAIG